MGNLSRTSSSWVRTSGSSGGCSGGCSSRDLVGGGSLLSAGSATRGAFSGGSSSRGSSSSICSFSPGSNPLFFSRVCVPAAARGSMEAAGEVSSSLGADMPIAPATTTASATAKSIMAAPTLRSIYQPSSSPSVAMGRPRSASPQQAPLHGRRCSGDPYPALRPSAAPDRRHPDRKQARSQEHHPKDYDSVGQGGPSRIG